VVDVPLDPRDREELDRTYRLVLRVVTAVILLAVLAIVLVVVTACRREPAAPQLESGTVIARHDETLPDGRTRADVTVEYPSGGSVIYRLDGDTPCVVGSTYPACAG
jgi:hypothetical protein